MSGVIRFVLILTLTTSAIFFPSYSHAQLSNERITAHVNWLEARNLNEDGLFDDGIDEIMAIYTLYESDQSGNPISNGNSMSSVWGPRNFYDVGGRWTRHFQTLSIWVQPGNTASFSLLLVEMDNSTQAGQVLTNGCQAMTAANLVLFILGRGVVSRVAQAGCGLVSLVMQGDDDTFENPLLFTLPTRFVTRAAPFTGTDTYTLNHSGWTNSAQYEMSYTVTSGY